MLESVIGIYNGYRNFLLHINYDLRKSVFMKTPTEIIEALGGTVDVARALGLAPTTVSSWKKAKRGIPSWRMEKLAKLAKRRGVELTQ